MNKAFRFLTLAMASFLPACPQAALAADPTGTWVGRMVDDRNVFLSVVHTDGSNYALRRNGASLGNYTAVTSNASCLELRADGGNEMIRIYSDRMEVSTGPGSAFMTVARGKWQD